MPAYAQHSKSVTGLARQAGDGTLPALIRWKLKAATFFEVVFPQRFVDTDIGTDIDTDTDRERGTDTDTQTQTQTQTHTMFDKTVSLNT